jgi:hypothetical protein
MNDQDVAEQPFEITITTRHQADIYLSCSWQDDAGQDAAWNVVRDLDLARIRAIGDVKGFNTQDETRIRRIMRGAIGFVVVLPFRESQPSRTSPYILEEIRIAAGQSFPIAVFYERRIGLKHSRIEDGVRLTFRTNSGAEPINIPHREVFGPFEYRADEPIQPQIAGKLVEFQDCIGHKGPPIVPPYAFLATRLKDDFDQARRAIETAVERTAGIPCLWAGCQRYACNVKNIQTMTRLMIKHCSFLVADMTYGPESPDYDSPSRAHEVGMADAFERLVCLVAQAPRRDTYFAADHMQMYFWENEDELNRKVAAWIDNHRGQVGRRVFNIELQARAPQYVPCIDQPSFAFDRTHRYVAPNVFPLTALESWVVAVGFGMMALALSLLAQRLLGFQDTFDYAAVLAAIVALIFSSDLSKGIRQALGQWKPLRWLIPITGVALLLVWASLR